MRIMLRRQTAGWRCAGAAEHRRRAQGGATTSRTNNYWLVRAIGWMRSHERATSTGRETRSRGDSRTLTWYEICRTFQGSRLPRRDENLFENFELLEALTRADGDAAERVVGQGDPHARFLLQAGAQPFQ